MNRMNREQNGEVNRRLYMLMEYTKYPICQFNGQRIFGPPDALKHYVPPHGSEVFVGKIPSYITEDELVPLFRRAGVIHRLRMMMNFSGQNRGYAFVSYTKPEYANTAITYLNNYEIRPNRHIGVYKSLDNCRLFLGNVPADQSREDLKEKLQGLVEGLRDIIMYAPVKKEQLEQGHVNRGYVFLEFDSHRSAAIARRALASGFKLGESVVTVDWADPIPEVDPAIMEKVTKLYIRNLHISFDNKDVLYHLGKHIPMDMIIRVHKLHDYAFVHFRNHQDAENAFRLLEGVAFNGQPIEVAWARPRIYSREFRMNSPAQNFCTSVPPRARRMVQNQKTLAQLCPGGSAGTSSGSYSPPSSPEDDVLVNLMPRLSLM